MTAAEQGRLPFDIAAGPSRIAMAPTETRRGHVASALADPDIPRPADGRLIWDGARQAFVSGVLRQAMLVRGFTADSLGVAAGVAHGTMYNALAGRTTRLSTARRILETLASVEPAFLLHDLM
jgi:hypothetical protein